MKAGYMVGIRYISGKAEYIQFEKKDSGLLSESAVETFLKTNGESWEPITSDTKNHKKWIDVSSGREATFRLRGNKSDLFITTQASETYSKQKIREIKMEMRRKETENLQGF